MCNSCPTGLSCHMLQIEHLEQVVPEMAEVQQGKLEKVGTVLLHCTRKVGTVLLNCTVTIVF